MKTEPQGAGSQHLVNNCLRAVCELIIPRDLGFKFF